MEKEGELSGILKSEQVLPFKHEMYELSLTFAKQCRDAGVEIRLNTEATKELAEKEAPDTVIIAAGSSPLVPPIPGLDEENVVFVNNYYLEKEKVGEEVVVFGGGLAGCEAAIHLTQEGKKVTIVEMRDEMAPDANVRHRPLLLKQLEGLATCRGLEVTAEGVVCEDKNKERHLAKGSSVICAGTEGPQGRC